MSEGASRHDIDIAPFGGRVRARFAGKTIADSSHALLLQEGSMAPVFYLPRGDVHIEYLTPSPHRSQCPFKGEASYFDVEVNGQSEVQAAWSYQIPLPAIVAIAGHLAFYPDKVAIETVPFG